MKNAELQESLSTKGLELGRRGQPDAPRAVKVRALLQRHLPSGRVLDVGCGDGSLLMDLAKKYQFTGVDISGPQVEEAKRNGYQEVRPGSLEEAFPFKDAEFDGVFCGEALEDVVDTDYALSEINRVLKQEGIFIMTVPNVRTPATLARWFLNDPPMFGARYRSGHVRDFTTKHIRLAMKRNGFEVLDLIGSDFYPIPFLSGLATYLPSFATTMIVVGRLVSRPGYEVMTDGRSKRITTK